MSVEEYVEKLIIYMKMSILDAYKDGDKEKEQILKVGIELIEGAILPALPICTSVTKEKKE